MQFKIYMQYRADTKRQEKKNGRNLDEKNSECVTLMQLAWVSLAFPSPDIGCFAGEPYPTGTWAWVGIP